MIRRLAVSKNLPLDFNRYRQDFWENIFLRCDDNTLNQLYKVIITKNGINKAVRVVNYSTQS